MCCSVLQCVAVCCSVLIWHPDTLLQMLVCKKEPDCEIQFTHEIRFDLIQQIILHELQIQTLFTKTFRLDIGLGSNDSTDYIT